MAYVFVDVVCRWNTLIEPCDSIFVCLADGWENKTVSGLPFAEVNKVVFKKEYCRPSDLSCVNSCCKETVSNGCSPSTSCAEDERYSVYQLAIDDSQFLTDPATSKPYLITADDVSEMFPYHCFASKLINFLTTNPDYYLDWDGVSIAADSGTNLQTISLPVKDRVNGDVLVGTGTIDIAGGIIGADLPNGNVVYTDGSGNQTTANIGDLLEIDVDGVTIVRDVGGIYSCVGPGITVVDNLNNTTQGANGYYVVDAVEAGNQLTLEKYPEHYSIAESVVFANQQYSTPVEVATLQNGDSSIVTPAFVSTVFNNPSTYRAMRILITLTGSFAVDIASATGFVVFGHSLWIDGVLVTTRNGRSDAGFNVSTEDGNDLLEDKDLPVIVYEHTIPAGGSVTIGGDFGDNDVFATVGTVNQLSIESRTINIVGGTI